MTLPLLYLVLKQVYRELGFLVKLNNPFICNCHYAFQDTKSLYLGAHTRQHHHSRSHSPPAHHPLIRPSRSATFPSCLPTPPPRHPAPVTSLPHHLATSPPDYVTSVRPTIGLVMDIALGGDLRYHLKHSKETCFNIRGIKWCSACIILALE